MNIVFLDFMVVEIAVYTTGLRLKTVIAALVNSSLNSLAILREKYNKNFFPQGSKQLVSGSKRPLSKLAPVRQVQGTRGAENRSVLKSYSEDLSTVSEQQLSTGVEFGKKSIIT